MQWVCVAVRIQASRRKKIASEKTLTMRFTSRLDTTVLSPPADQAPKKTKTTAAMTTVAQKTPMPAITKSWCASSGRGGTSGIRIFFDFCRNVMGTSVEHLRCHRQEPHALKRLKPLERFLEKTRIVEAINYGGETACFVASKMGKTDLPGIETNAISSAARV